MTYALATFDKPAANTPWPQEMHFYVHEMPTDEATTRLSEGAWLLDLDTELLTLAQMVNTASRAGCPIRVLFFDQKPQFAAVVAEQKA